MDEVPIALGDRWFVVVFTYFIVLLPWAIIQAIDFIGPKWKTVRKTRENGLRQFWFTLIPLTVMVPYIALQISAGDFKEMSAAFVAVLFAVLHLCRTWWGLWQLREFHSWATNAIRILDSQGVTYHLELSKNQREVLRNMTLEESFSWKAGLIQVNESIVDNQIMEGDTRCYCQWKKTHRKESIINISEMFRNRRFLKFLTPRSIEKINIANFTWKKMRMFGGLFINVCTQILSLMKSTEQKSSALKFLENCLAAIDPTRHWFELKPFEPTEVWIRWAVAFSCQGLSGWIRKYDIVPNPGGPNGDPSGFRDRQRYYAREVLTSAYILKEDSENLKGRNVEFGPGHPLQWNLLSLKNSKGNTPSLFHENGRVSRSKLLLHAWMTGNNLPFSCKHIQPDQRKNKLSRNLTKFGLKLYEYDVQQAAQGMPAKFGNVIDEFDYQKLECLTIMLTRGVWESVKMEQAADYEDHRYFEGQRQEGEILVEDDHQITILKRQLGLSTDSSPIVKDAELINKTNICSPNLTEIGPFALPVLQKGINGRFGQNRNVTDVSSILDVWNALNSGSSVRYVLDKDSSWIQACLTNRRLHNFSTFNDDSAIEVVSKGLNPVENISDFRRSNSAGSPPQMESEVRSNSMQIRHANRMLEKVRLGSEFGVENSNDVHLDQTMSFLGISMESVRSSLASEIFEKGVPETWRPEIKYVQDHRHQSTENFLKFNCSESFTSALKSISGSEENIKGFLSDRIIQIRLIWELQRFSINSLNGKANPQDHTAMISCLLSYPSLSVNVICVSSVGAWKRGTTTYLNMDSVHCKLEVHPVGAPQMLYSELLLCLEKSRDGVYTTTLSANISRSDVSYDLHFEWESWRDAFSGRFIGAREWKESHEMEFSKECTTYTHISKNIEIVSLEDRRAQSNVKVWMGWLPFQPQICDFELDAKNISTKNEVNYKRELLEQRLQELSEKQLEYEHKPLQYFWKLLQNNYENETMEMTIEKEFDLWKLNMSKHKEESLLNLLELAASSGLEIGIKKAMSILCTERASKAYILRALSLTKSFTSFKERLGALKPHMECQVEEWYKDMVKYSKYDASVVSSFSKFQRTLCNFKNQFKEEYMMAYLRKSFMRTGSPVILREMILLCSYCGNLLTPKTPLGSAELFPIKVAGSSWGAWLPVRLYLRYSLFHENSELNDDEEWKHHLSNLLFDLSTKSEKDFCWMKKILEHQLEHKEPSQERFRNIIEKDSSHGWITSKLMQFLSEQVELVSPGNENFMIQSMNIRRRNSAIILGDFHFSRMEVQSENLFYSIFYHGVASLLGSLDSIRVLNTILFKFGGKNEVVRVWIIDTFRYGMGSTGSFYSQEEFIKRGSNLLHDWDPILTSEIFLIVETLISIMNMEDSNEKLGSGQMKQICARELVRIIENESLPESVRINCYFCLSNLASSKNSTGKLTASKNAKKWLKTLNDRGYQITTGENPTLSRVVQKNNRGLMHISVLHLNKST